MAAKEPTVELCEVRTEDDDVCTNRATRFRLKPFAPRLACEECLAALIDEGKIYYEDFAELPSKGDDK